MRKRCYDCGSRVPRYANICRYCGYDFAQAEYEERESRLDLAASFGIITIPAALFTFVSVFIAVWGWDMGVFGRLFWGIVIGGGLASLVFEYLIPVLFIVGTIYLLGYLLN